MLPSGFSSETLLLMAAVFFLAGLVKGIVGLGLPSVAVGLGSIVVGVRPAMALLIVPSFVTNVWQAVAGNALTRIVSRTWPMMAMIAIGTWGGVWLLARLDPRLISACLGATLIGYALMGFAKPQLPHPGSLERWISLPVGIIHGIVAGLTGSYIPAVPFLISLGLGKAELVQAMGIVFTLSTIALALAMAEQRLLPQDLASLSALAVAPALAGMWAGQHLRAQLSEEHFKRALFTALGLLGAYILWRALAALHRS